MNQVGVKGKPTGCFGPCRPQKQQSSLSGLLHQAVFVMQPAEHRRFHNPATGWQQGTILHGTISNLLGFRLSNSDRQT